MVSVPQDHYNQQAQQAQQAQELAKKKEEWNQSSYGQWGIPYIDSGSDKFASKLRAALTRQQWEDWKTQFQPVFTQLSDTIGDEQTQQADINRASAVVNRSFDAVSSDMDRRNAQYGVSPDATTQQAMDTNLGLSRAASMASARNRTRDAIENREMGLMVGGLSSIGQTQEDS